MQKRVIGLSILLILSAIISVSFISAYVPNYSCNITTVAACNNGVGGNIVLGLSAPTNAHADFPYNISDNYPNALCCYFGTGSTSCSLSNNLYYQSTGTNVAQNKLIGLTSPTNAHSETPGQIAYTTPACYQGLECISTTNAAGCVGLSWPYQNQVYFYNINVLNLSGNTNAHIGSGPGFDTSVCCRVVGLNTACKLTSATWTYSNAMQKVQAGLNVTGTNCAGATVTFNVTDSNGRKANNIPGDVTFPINAPTTSSIAGTWTAEYATGQPNSYKFKSWVTSNSNTFLMSGDGGGQNASLSVAQQPISFCTGISTCGDYKDSANCTSDTSLCNVAKNDPNRDPNAYSYGCAWNTTSNLCNFINVYQANGALTCNNGFTLCTNQTSGLGYCYPGNTCPNAELPLTNGNGVCDASEGCSSIDCNNGNQDNCATGTLCQAGMCYKSGVNATNITQCANAYTLCYNSAKALTYCYPNDVCPAGDTAPVNSCANSNTTNGNNGNPSSCLGDSVCHKTTGANGYCSSPTASVGKCVYSFVGTGDTCADGFLTYKWTATWTGNGNKPANCASGQSVIECPAQIPLPLFTAVNAVIAILAVIIIYVVVVLVRKSKKHTHSKRSHRRK